MCCSLGPLCHLTKIDVAIPKLCPNPPPSPLAHDPPHHMHLMLLHVLNAPPCRRFYRSPSLTAFFTAPLTAPAQPHSGAAPTSTFFQQQQQQQQQVGGPAGGGSGAGGAEQALVRTYPSREDYCRALLAAVAGSPGTVAAEAFNHVIASGLSPWRGCWALSIACCGSCWWLPTVQAPADVAVVWFGPPTLLCMGNLAVMRQRGHALGMYATAMPCVHCWRMP